MQPYEFDAYRRQGFFGEALMAALRQAGMVPDSFLAEFGPQQFEVTVAPALGMRAADEAVITRELTQAVAFRFGHRASFTPLPTPSGTRGAEVCAVPPSTTSTRLSLRAFRSGRTAISNSESKPSISSIELK